MKAKSPEFEDGGRIPERYGYTQKNVNPPVEISGVPEAAESLVLVMDDPDAVEPAGKIWVHWTLWNIDPETRKIEEDSAPGTEGTTDFRQTGYNGPNPPDGEHTYRIEVYALDSMLGLEEGASREELDKYMDGHVLEKAELAGTFPLLEN